MPSGRSRRLIAAILLVLLLGWAVQKWRNRVETEESRLLRTGEEETGSAAEIDLPRE